MIRENLHAIGDELYAAYWWSRCKSAGTVALVAVCLGQYCQWRGKRAFVALWLTRRTIALARLLLPLPLRHVVTIACGK